MHNTDKTVYNMIDFFKLDDLYETKQMFINFGKRG